MKLRALAVFLVTATGCGDHPQACVGEDEAHCALDRVIVDGVQRTFVVSGRDSLDCGRGRAPVVFAFHGSGANGAYLRSYLGLEEELPGRALFVYPDGLGRADTVGQTGWNRDLEGDDLRFFDAMVAKLAEDVCLDTTHLYSVGHSRGGRFVELLACTRPLWHRAFASIAAGTDGFSSCTGRGPMWLTHGVDDKTVPFTDGQRLLQTWAARNGCEPPAASYPVDVCTGLPGCEPGLPVVWCPNSEAVWRGHHPPAFAPAQMRAFFERF